MQQKPEWSTWFGDDPNDDKGRVDAMDGEQFACSVFLSVAVALLVFLMTLPWDWVRAMLVFAAGTLAGATAMVLLAISWTHR